MTSNTSFYTPFVAQEQQTNKHLMTGPWETVNFVSLESQCFPRDQLLSELLIYSKMRTLAGAM